MISKHWLSFIQPSLRTNTLKWGSESEETKASFLLAVPFDLRSKIIVLSADC